ncbi:MAG: dicarboxylate/amino acid:cation symporter [Bacteroidales bacterium]
MKNISLHWQILIALTGGILSGWLFPPAGPFVGWIGVIFLKMLKLIVVPLVFFSIVSGMAGMGRGRNLGRIALKTLGLYVGTMLLAIVTGLFLVVIIKPGVGGGMALPEGFEGLQAQQKTLGDILLGIFPDNIFKAFSEPNMLGIIIFSILLGAFIPTLEESYSLKLTAIFEAFSSLMLKLTLFIIRFTPLGIFGLITQLIAQQANNPESLTRLGGGLVLYALIVVGAILFHGLVTMSLVLYMAGVSPLKHFKGMATVLLTAFSTSSSNATLPLSMEEVIEKAGVSKKIASFTLPLGATINMNGTALYECVAVIFIAQVYGIPLSITQILVVVVTALLAAIGSAGIPMAGLVMMSIILSAVGLPLEGIALILAIDRPLDMMRTALNVYGDTCAAVIIARSEGEKIYS